MHNYSWIWYWVWGPAQRLDSTVRSHNGYWTRPWLLRQICFVDYPTFNPHFKMNTNYRYVHLIKLPSSPLSQSLPLPRHTVWVNWPRWHRFFYAIAPMSNNSRWFDSIIKVDRQSRTISAQWSSDGVFVTEADFIPLSSGVQPGDEDVGVLVSVLYNSTTDSSTIALFNSSDLTLLQMYPMGYPVPFHAHGISCAPNKPCWTNP